MKTLRALVKPDTLMEILALMGIPAGQAVAVTGGVGAPDRCRRISLNVSDEQYDVILQNQPAAAGRS